MLKKIITKRSVFTASMVIISIILFDENNPWCILLSIVVSLMIVAG